MIQGVNFQPWISDNYKKGNFEWGRVLILGESHYDTVDEEEEQKDTKDSAEERQDEATTENNFTSTIVELYLSKKYNGPFFRNLGLMFNPNDRYELWNNVAFANGIQVNLSNSTAQPAPEDIALIKEVFWRLLDGLQPDKILVCSKRMWNNWMPDDSPRGTFVTGITENGKHSTVWKYQLEGKSCTAMGINHPSKYFSYDNWRPIVMKFLSGAY